ncbi:gag/pol/env polyprotein, putative [Perkinsus marinus ATCC 50983]|uniref:Gag/pol/env polyprotein, putative n=1 Tax=Perkinsus marinus (strain ATCC 50983 / TXsc) TaxID=423536 RepID=C5L3W8_PERM5|nr:gag/pol/env polyprotein, putative [Perkinsus marinus ATCC 50983]EER08697.1 gag/pol/env polyprotein, putative [Perkinsus marinus ATCC 50983]|eukprot:XP_002776881.1 gag/pol/env polyprotein, putative [Perkinsus marinus ATCC 50983]
MKYKEDRCKFCGLFHSIKSKCPEKYDSYQKKCSRCGRVNHGTMACFSNNPTVQGLSVVLIDNPGMGTSHFIDFEINDCQKPLRALLDSGAAMSVIHEAELTKIPDVVIQPTDLVVRTADGGSPKVTGIVRNLKLTFADDTVVYESFVVVDTPLSHAILLSTNALRGVGAVWFMTDKDNLMLLGGDAKSSIAAQRRHRATRTYSPQPIDYGVVEICDLVVEPPKPGAPRRDAYTSTTSIPNDLMEEMIISSYPQAEDDDDLLNKKGLTADQKVQQTKIEQAKDIATEDTKPFKWKLLPSTPKSRLGRFCLDVPWIDDRRPDGRLNGMAIQRAIATDSRLRDKERAAYLEVIKSLYDEGYVRHERRDNIEHLIPSFPVVRPDHATTKVRLVTDGSTGLNRLCRDGPVMNDDRLGMTLMSNLHLFRLSPYVILDDLRRAFYQVKIDPENEPYFGMANKYGSEMLYGVWTAMGFGSNYAPSALGQVLTTIIELNDFHHSDDHDVSILGEVALQVLDDYNLSINHATIADETPPIEGDHKIIASDNAAQSDGTTIRSHVSIYVDDVQSRGDTIPQVEGIARKVMGGLRDHGFEDNPKKRMKSWLSHEGHYLGYGVKDDYMFVDYRPNLKLLEKKGGDLTRREAFRLIMAYYDPIGLGVEFAGRLRYLGRQCYQHSTSWDAKIDDNYGTELIKLCKYAVKESAKATTTPRHLNIETIYVSTDASLVAGSQQVYDADCQRLYGSCHLYSAAEDKWSIPKKETMAFCDGVCKVANYVKMITNLHYDTNIKKIVIHVDSECVIYRLRRVKALRKMKTITSLETKRLEDVITKINELGSMGITVEVRHINGDKNPADGPSRPHGNDAPSPMTRTEVQHAVATASIATLDVVFDPRLTDEKDDLQAVDGNPPICKVNVIDIEHFFEDEEIKHLQDADGRLSTIKATLRNVPLNERPNGMRMYCLDENNVLYFTGITSIVDKSRTVTPLPVIPRGPKVQECLLTLHEGEGHVGAAKLLAIYQQWYSTPKVRQVLRRLLQSCPVCQRTRERACTRRAGGVVRPPGLHFGVGSCYVLDLQGPFLECDDDPDVPQKKWGLTMTDPVSFHVLFDVLDNPSTGAVIDSVHKIIAMNGIPQAVVMDPGSCFTSSDFKMYLKSQAIAYTYLPRDAQHLGGFHERVHGTILQQVRSRLARAELQDEPITFVTIYSEAVASVNRLPLNDFGGLTPFELYHGRRPRYLAGSCTGEDARLGQQLIDEWLPGLRRDEQDVLESDLQMLCEEIYERRCQSMTDYFDLWKERTRRCRRYQLRPVLSLN